MKAEVENYKGIEFVRISTLPEDQKKVFLASVHGSKIIKILRGDELLSDCLRYQDYSAWYQAFYKTTIKPAEETTPLRAKELKLAFK